MIYIIDDKTRRQEDYGWSEKRFESLSDVVRPINTFAELSKSMDEMLTQNSIILYRESFHDSVSVESRPLLEKMENRIMQLESSIYIAKFSGSVSTRWIDEDDTEGRYCTLPPDVLYDNLGIFIKHVRKGDVNLRYLLFGEKYLIEQEIRDHMRDVNSQNATVYSPLETEKSLFFALNFDNDLQIVPPFTKYESNDSWDFFEKSVEDKDLDLLVREWLGGKSYDAIYIPLCFGTVLSDFLGLRLAMHIRLTNTPNQYIPIFIYGCADWKDVVKNECSDILRTRGVEYISPDNTILQHTLDYMVCSSDEALISDLKNVHVNIPSNIGDNHSVANKWAIHRWFTMIDWEGDAPDYNDDDFYKSLYFKYLEVTYGKHDKFSKGKKYYWRIEGLEGKSIVYVDDEYNKGWETILGKLFKKNGAQFHVFKNFDKIHSQKELIDSIESFLVVHPSDCHLIDLRLHSNDFGRLASKGHLTGQSIISFLLGKDREHPGCGNPGNKVIVFTASNKVWNLQEAEANGAFGYYIKESPENNYTRRDTLSSYASFIRMLKSAVNQSYIRIYCDKLARLKTHYGDLDGFIKLLILDKSDTKKDSLKALLIRLIVFFENYLEQFQGFKFLQKDTFYKNDKQIKGYSSMNSLLLKYEYDKAGKKRHTDFRFGYLTPELGNSGWEPADVKTDKGYNNPIALAEAAMHYYYRIDSRKIEVGKSMVNPCQFYFKMKMQRNKAAHELGDIDISIEDIKALFGEIILPCMEIDDNPDYKP